MAGRLHRLVLLASSFAMIAATPASSRACDETLSGPHDDGYRGCQTITRSGSSCQKWTSQSPNSHSVYSSTPNDYIHKGLGDHSFCRNPDGSETIWCYTTDVLHRWGWGYCNPLATTDSTEDHAPDSLVTSAPSAAGCERCPVGRCDRNDDGTCGLFLGDGSQAYHCVVESCEEVPSGSAIPVSTCWTWIGVSKYSIYDADYPCQPAATPSVSFPQQIQMKFRLGGQSLRDVWPSRSPLAMASAAVASVALLFVAVAVLRRSRRLAEESRTLLPDDDFDGEA